MATAPSSESARVRAVLGPTNTGKTHFAIERLLGHGTGMIGFPLRLLARENYDRVVKLKGASAVALVTGEEKILPPRPRYWVCTVESMPLDQRVDCLAVDEIQLAGDAERGHIFTDRLLHARGMAETLFLGSDTARTLIQRLVPGVELIQRDRLSTLTYAGAKKLTRLPPRSAIVAFSAAEVYETAELIRRQKGGAAVVMGALSPRTRNAQVALYQAGEVDYLVATDAIGMGLNMDIDHVAFAKLSKFDGVRPRRLTAQEIGQIAGRAGRHMTNGTFGTTGNIGELDPDLVEAVENHRFDPLTLLMWRNSDLDFRSPTALLRSLDASPPYNCLRRTRDADDHKALAALAHDPDVVARAHGRKAVELMWEVCQVPDFRKVMSDQHTRLLSQIFLHLATEGRVPDDWVDGQVKRLESTEGDIDTLVTRIAHIRTWTYIANRPSWIAKPLEWQERTRAIEDRLSDALHERLTQRFIDRRAAGLVRSLEKGGDLLAGVQPGGAVVVEGHPVGQLTGFRFIADATTLGSDAKPVLTAARRALRSEIARRVALLEQAPDEEFTLTTLDQVAWNDAPVARLAQGGVLLKPRIVPLESDLLVSGESDRIRDRVAAWLDAEIGRRLPMLTAIADAQLDGPARGLAFQLAESLAPIERGKVETLLAGLTRKDAGQLARLGITIGTAYAFLKGLTKPAALTLLRALWRAGHDVWGELPMPPPGRVSVAADPNIDSAYYAAIGFPVVGPRAIRVDMLDRLIARLRRATVDGAMPADPTIAPVLGCGKEEADQVLAVLGWGRREAEGVVTYRRQRPAQPAGAPRRRRVPPLTHDDRSPFAVLKQLGRAK
ncbi:MAG TPA: helicase-related protein [Alphaproteobacteria bacterium]|jgi:ATP-dependent RNA helicase SUPV3L1/SUV3|nr:helicase-related protein [Alphaproteobacteria bacterium]